MARRAAPVGPVVELATGTGRIAVPLAEAGHRVVGVDRDPAMLERARARADRSPQRAEVVERLRWLEADLVDVDRSWPLPAAAGFGGPGAYGLAILAVGSILLLPDEARQRAAVATMARLLAPGGIAVLDTWLVGPEERAAYDGSVSLEWVRVDPETGSTVTKLASGQHEPDAGSLVLTTLFDEGRPGEPVVRWTRTDRLRLLGAAELQAFAEAAGLAVEAVAGDPEMRPLDADAERVVIVAHRPPER